jgi:hypothetical protein
VQRRQAGRRLAVRLNHILHSKHTRQVVKASVTSGLLHAMAAGNYPGTQEGGTAMDTRRGALLTVVGVAVIAASFFLSLWIFSLLD